MFHENIRVVRHHRGLAARAVTFEVASHPGTDGNPDENGDHNDNKPGGQGGGPPDEKTRHPEDTSLAVPETTFSVVQPVSPIAPDTVVASPTITPSTIAPAPPVPPVTTTTPVRSAITTSPVLPATTTSSVATPLTSSSQSVSIKVPTVTTAGKTSSTNPVSISAKASASSAPVASSAVSGGAVAGGVIGGLSGLALLLALVFFVVRHYRKKSLDDLVFNASKFRRSALLLDDPPEKEKMQEQHGPRPPSMIAQHFNAPAVPQASAASPYSEHAVQSTDPYGHYATAAAQYNLGMYGADGQVTRDPYADIYSGNSPSGQHPSNGQSAFGFTPMQFQFPQRPYHQHQHQEYQSSFVSGAQSSTAAVNAPLPHPFSNATSTSSALAVARDASQTTATDSSHALSRDTSSKPEVLQRRPSTKSTASEDDPKYANIQRDIKVAPDTSAFVSNDSNAPSSASVASAAQARSNTRRPVSSYTVYDPEDAYGGM